MPNVSEKKKKLLYLLKILLEKTDHEHALTLPQILEELESMGISAERKSIYDDLETLRSVGVEIGTRKNRTFQYYMAKRQFSLPELRLVAEALRAAPFLSQEQSAELAGKLAALCSSYEAEGLRLDALPQGGSQQDQPETPLTVPELLRRAMAENRQVRFQLLEWRLSSRGKPERSVKKSGKTITASPWQIFREQGREMLAAYDGAVKKIRYFRVDDIAAAEMLSTDREGGELFAQAQRQERPEEKIALEFSEELLGEVAERFGPDFTAEPVGKNRLRAALRAQLDPEFFAWLFARSPEVRLAAPKKLMEQFRERAKTVAKLYKS